MHVVFLISSFAPLIGGGEVQTERQAKELAALGLRVTVLTRQPPESLSAPSFEMRDGYQVIRFLARDRWTSIWHMTRWVWEHRHEVDLLHARQANSPLIAALAAQRLTGLPVICTPMTASPELGWVNRQGLLTMLRRSFMRRVYWTAKSDTISSVLSPYFPHVRPLPNGVDTDYFTPGERQTPVQVIAVCRLAWPKRLDLVINAWDDCWGAELLIVGDGPYRDDLERLVHERGLRSVRFLGAHSEVAATLKGASIYVHASDTEGMPNALMEAMSAGLYCLGSGVGQIPDMLSGVGVVVENDVSSWRASLEQALSDPAHRTQQGQAARQKVINNYGLRNIVLNLRQLYLEVQRRKN